MLKKMLSALLALCLCLSGCAPAGPALPPEPCEPPESGAPAETAGIPAEPPDGAPGHAGEWRFTDSLGRTASFSGPLTRVAPSGKLAQQCIYALAPEAIIGLSAQPTGLEERYFPKEFTELPVFGTFYGKKADFNRESVLLAAPQAIVDMGQVKGGMREDLDALQEQLGIPVIFIEAVLEDSASAFTALGELFEKPGEAKALADYCASAAADAREKAASIPGDGRRTVYYGMGGDGLTTAAKGDFHTEVIDLTGAENVVPPDLGRSYMEVDLERLLKWDPDVIIFAPGGAYESAPKDPRWQKLRAVSSGEYYEVPAGPYSWLDQPPGANRYIGIKWLGELLYPDVFDYDMAAEAVEFYDLFYHISLTDGQARELMAGSLYRQ